MNAPNWNNAGRLLAVLRKHGFDGAITGETKGPTVTRYAFAPSDAVRVESLTRYEQTLAVALQAHSVRVAGPIPGTPAVAIEVAQPAAAPVLLADLFASVAWRERKGALPVALGVECAGAPVLIDLAACPHLLIAGTTGSGKSVALTSLILSLAKAHTPRELRLMLIDPKVVEFQQFAKLPHLLVPPISRASKVVGALGWLLREMEARYRVFSALGVRKLAAHNAASHARDRLPYIVVVIDELADLMLMARGEFETGIARLAQLARAAGIHLVVATQRPSVNVITGVIKANFPARLAFRVASATDSRVILDGKGAEGLLGKGDALWLGPGSNQAARVQCAFVEDAACAAMLAELGTEAPAYVDAAQKAVESGALDPEPDEAEGVLKPAKLLNFDQVIEVVAAYGFASPATIAAELRCSRELAAEAVAKLEHRGICAKGEGDARRPLLVNLSFLTT